MRGGQWALVLSITLTLVLVLALLPRVLAPSGCGDSNCITPETCSSCPQDCGACPGESCAQYACEAGYCCVSQVCSAQVCTPSATRTVSCGTIPNEPPYVKTQTCATDGCSWQDTSTCHYNCGGGTPAVCDDANPCTTDNCAAATGCYHSNVGAGIACSGGVCDGQGNCLPSCTSVGGMCRLSIPTNSVAVTGYCDSTTPYCRACPSAYPVYNATLNACVPSNVCTPAGLTQCQQNAGVYQNRTCSDQGGWLNWGSWVNCPATYTCSGAVCAASMLSSRMM